MFKIGDVINLKIDKIVFGGEGLGFYENIAVFVPMSCIGDYLQVEIISIKKTYMRALIQKILVASNDREHNEKITFSDYNGCDFAHIKYEKQIEYKDIIIKDIIKSMCKIDVSDFYEGIISANKITNYRNKVAMPFFKENAEIKVGFYEKKSHNLFSVEKDDLISESANEIVKAVCKKMNENNFTVYNEKNNQGFLKHLIIRNNSKNEILLGVVVASKTRLNKLSKVLKDIYLENENVKSVYISIKNRVDNVIIGDENICLIGGKYIEEELNGLKFKIYLDSFFQINLEQVKKLYNKVFEYLGDKNSNIIDAYSGTGTIAMMVSKKAKKVFAIEEVKSSVLSANQTSKENNIDNIEFVCNKVENVINKLITKNKIDTIIFDPPRKGMERKIIEQVSKTSIERIIYVSCNPATFARDLNIFIENSYELTKLSAVDMFPNTHHIEIVSVIEKRK